MVSSKIGFLRRFRLRISVVSWHSANAELQIVRRRRIRCWRKNFKMGEKARKRSERLLDYGVEIEETK